MISIQSFMVLVAVWYFAVGCLNVYFGTTRKEVQLRYGTPAVITGLLTILIAFLIVILP